MLVDLLIPRTLYIFCVGGLAVIARRAFDLAAYLSTDGRVVIGLPRDTPVRAIASGRVFGKYKGEYLHQVVIEHGIPGSGLYSTYTHLNFNADLNVGDGVKQGQEIGTLFIDSLSPKGI